MPKRRQNLSRKFGFQAGNSPWNKGKNYEFSNDSTDKKSNRLTKKTFNRRVKENHNNVLEIHNVDGTPVARRILRPRPGTPDTVDQYLAEAELNPSCESESPHVFSPWCVEELFNTEIRKHTECHPDCSGFLRFDL